MTTTHTLSEKTTAMEKAIRMAKEIYPDKAEFGYTQITTPAEPNINPHNRKTNLRLANRLNLETKWKKQNN